MSHKVQIAALTTIVLWCSGCTFYQPRPVTFAVRDGDTGLPIPEASVEATYRTMIDFGLPFASFGPRTGKTDSNGDLTLFLDPTKSSFYLRVYATDYQNPNWQGSSIESPSWHGLKPRGWLSFSDVYQVQLFRGPMPEADIVLPTDYRGIVVVKFSPESSPPSVPGQRKFTYPASSQGRVEINETALFESSRNFGGIRARYRNGTVFQTVIDEGFGTVTAKERADDAVALRLITVDWANHIWLYVLGTTQVAAVVNRSVYPGEGEGRFDELAFKRIIEGTTFPTR